ncbi:MAG: glycosyltransferase [Schaedlerella sp.]|nr:glycosyltransferase [Schaedlerella sp.]
MNKNKVTISVIMGIYNCASTLPDAINSILKQTITDWELILCDDASQDNTLQIALDFEQNNPNKIIVLSNEQNMGLNATLNRCLQVAKGKYIARMDGDDICHPERFKEELEVLENEPEISIVSTDMNFFDESGIWGKISHPEYPTEKDFLKKSPFCHAACMVRKEAYYAVEGYSVDSKLLRVEDYHLWFKMYKAGLKGKNIHKCLYSMRDDQNAYNRRKFKYRINEAYVKYLTVKELELPVWGYIYVLKPIFVGLLPRFLYDILHKSNLRR